MARKKRNLSALPTFARPASAQSPAAAGQVPAPSGQRAFDADATTLTIFSLMMFLVPTLGVPNEELLQDSLKSALVALGTLGAACLLAWRLWHHPGTPMRWHGVLALPLALMAWALGSMAWSHAYLAGVEAIRWFIVALIVWLALNAAARQQLPRLVLGIHAGGVGAAFWGVLQFWFDLSWFPQGPNPASTFVNRNFAAEWVVVALPFSVWALLQARRRGGVALAALTLGLNIVFIFMTGTRSALAALAGLALVMPALAWLYRDRLAFSGWTPRLKWLAAGVLLVGVGAMGQLPTGNPRLVAEHQVEGRGLTAFERAYARSVSALQQEEYTRKSFSVRLVMWKDTLRMIAAHPWVGVGAGAWEVQAPLYQTEGLQLETDYYAHNEYLQLLAEYGLVGWGVLLGLLSYLARCAWRTLRSAVKPREASEDERQEAPWRALALAGLLALLMVSGAGFPWRLATTGAMLGLCLGLLAASDLRLGWGGGVWRVSARAARTGWVAACGCLVLGGWITQQAVACESRLVRAVRIALAVSQSGQPNHPRWAASKAQMLELVREGVALNRHYRKITPMVADELARWGDWQNAVWVWESVIGSRPYVVAILSNIARGYAQAGQNDKAQEYLRRAKQLQPYAPAVTSLEVILLSRAGREAQALQAVRDSLARGSYDFDLLNAAYALGSRAGDVELARSAMQRRNTEWPEHAIDGWLKLGHLHALGRRADPEQALRAYTEALRMTRAEQRGEVLGQMPLALRERALAAASAAAPQAQSN